MADSDTMATYRVDLSTVELMVEKLLTRAGDYRVVRNTRGQELVFRSAADRDQVLTDLVDTFRTGLELACEQASNRSHLRYRFA